MSVHFVEFSILSQLTETHVFLVNCLFLNILRVTAGDSGVTG